MRDAPLNVTERVDCDVLPCPSGAKAVQQLGQIAYHNGTDNRVQQRQGKDITRARLRNRLSDDSLTDGVKGIENVGVVKFPVPSEIVDPRWGSPPAGCL
jgi:hypothetical protein